MRSARFLMPAAVAVIAVGMFCSAGQAAITGTAHDFATTIGGGQVCLPCHTPHGGNDPNKGTDGKGPIWNHALPAKTTGYTFTLYDSSGAPEVHSTDLDPNSILCMGCHDGVTNTDAYGGAAGTQVIATKGRIGNAAGDLTGNHPIGTAAAYPVKAADPTLSDKPYMNDPKNFPSGMTLKPMNGSYVVGCTSCHEPHKRGGNEHMLWVRNAGSITVTYTGSTLNANGSGLCFTCHKNK